MIKPFLVLLLASAVLGQGIAWGDIQTGKVTPVTIFSGNASSSAYTYSIPHGLATATFQATLSWISYNAILSSIFAFNTTILSQNSSELVFNVQTYNTTYFNILSYHYMLTNHSTLDINLLCYYTSSLYTSNGSREVTYSNATTALSGAYLSLTTVLTGFKVENYQGTYLSVKVSSTISNGVILTTISTEEYNLVEWVCLAVVVYNPKTTIIGEFYLRQTATVNYTTALSNCIVGDPAFLLPHTMFFGISTVKMFLYLDNQQIFIMNTDNTADPLFSPIINQNQGDISLEQLFMWTDSCITPTTQMVPLTGYTCSTGCNALEYSTTEQYCLSCGIGGGNCLTCDSTQCLTCDNTNAFRTMDTGQTPNICICSPTYFQLNSVCTPCSDYLANCLQCSAQTTCTTCNVTFVPQSGICVCSAGTYVINNTCVPLKGCLSYYEITNAAYCSLCDTSKNFYLLSNQTCECLANTVFNNINGICEGNCSDGASLGNQCDLGALNGVTGSGCAANCTIVEGYYCSNPSTAQASVCVLSTNYTGTYMYSTKELSDNTANIYVQLSPNDAVLAEMDFSSLVTTSIPTTSITCTFDSSTGILIVHATYSQSIEGSSHNLTIAFDATKRYSPSIEVTTQMDGVNAKLEFGSFETYNNIIFYLSMFVGGITFIFAIVSGLVGFKMVGLEMCMPVQITYLSLCFLNVPYSALSSLYGFSTSTGYNQLSSFNLINYLNLDKGLIVLQRNNFFLQNCNYTYIPLVVLLLLALVTRQCVSDKVVKVPKNSPDLKKKKDNSEKISQEKIDEDQPKEMSRAEKAYYFIIDRLLINFWMLLLLLAVFSFGIQIQTEEYNSKYSFNLNIAIGIMVILAQLGGLIFIVFKIKEKDKTVTLRTRSRYYPIFYIGCQLAVVILIVCTYYLTEYAIFLPIIPQTILVFFYVKLAPHGPFKSFVTITGLCIQLVPIIATALFIVNRYLSMAMFATISAFIIISLFLIGQGLSIARLVFKYRQHSSHQKQHTPTSKIKIQAENLQAMTYSSIKNQLMNNNTQRKLNWQAINQAQAQNSKAQKIESKKFQIQQESQQHKLDQEQDDLKKLKMRLRKQIFEKRNLDL